MRIYEYCTKTFTSQIRKISEHSNSIYISQVWNVLECNKRRSIWTNRFVSRFAFVNRRHPSELVHLLIWVHVVVSVRVFCVCVCVLISFVTECQTEYSGISVHDSWKYFVQLFYVFEKTNRYKKNMVGYLVFLA